MRMFAVLFLFYSTVGVAQMADDLPPSFDTIDPVVSSDNAVSKNAEEVVKKARKIFKDAYDKAQGQFKNCKSDPGDKASCLLAGVLFNYSLSYAEIIGHSEDFRMTVTASETNKNFKPEEEMLVSIMEGINWLKEKGYYFGKNGSITLPGPPVVNMSLADFNDEAKLNDAGLKPSEIQKIKDILATISTKPVPLTKVAKGPANQYEVVDDSEVTESPDSAERMIASLNVTFQSDPIAVAMADIFDVVSLVYDAVEPELLPPE